MRKNHLALGRLLKITLITLLVLVIAVARQPQAAQAQSGRPVRFYMNVVNSKNFFCVGDSKDYQVIVHLQYLTQLPGEVKLAQDPAIDSVKIEAFSADPEVGNVEPSQQITNFAYTADDIGDMPHTAEFAFHAKKAGSTVIYFEGLVRGVPGADPLGSYVSFNLPVRVDNCNYKVVSISRWSRSMAGATVKAVAILPEAKLRVTTERSGTGNGAMYWVVTAFVQDFNESNTLEISDVSVLGEQDRANEGNILLTLTFTSIGGSETTCGLPGCAGGSINLTPATIKVSLPSVGGSITLAHHLDGTAGGADGETTVYLLPEKTQ